MNALPGLVLCLLFAPIFGFGIRAREERKVVGQEEMIAVDTDARSHPLHVDHPHYQKVTSEPSDSWKGPYIHVMNQI